MLLKSLLSIETNIEFDFSFPEETTLPIVQEGLSSTKRPSSDFDLAISVMTVAGLSEESFQKSLEACKNQISFYASTPAYKGV